MKTIFSILFFTLAFMCRSQEGTNSKNNEGINREEETSVANDNQNSGTTITAAESESKEKAVLTSSGNPENADSKIEKEKTYDKKITDKKSQNKKGRRGNSNILIYVAVGIVAIAVIVYIATSSSTTKM